MSDVKIRLLRATYMGVEGVGVPGQEFDVSQELAQQLVGNGRAERVRGRLYERGAKAEEKDEEPVVEAATVEPSEEATAEPQRSGAQRRRP